MRATEFILENTVDEMALKQFTPMGDFSNNEQQQGIANFMAELQDLYGKKAWFIRSILKKARE